MLFEYLPRHSTRFREFVTERVDCISIRKVLNEQLLFIYLFYFVLLQCFLLDTAYSIAHFALVSELNFLLKIRNEIRASPVP